MSSEQRPDDFTTRHAHLEGLTDEELYARFWSLVDRIVTPLVAEARTHTSPAIERSVLLRMGLASDEAKSLVERMGERNLLARGAGRLVLELAQRHGMAPRDVGVALLSGRLWDEIDA